jgi:DNA ligase N terminus
VHIGVAVTSGALLYAVRFTKYHGIVQSAAKCNAQVHKAFLEIARTEGQKSQDRKKALINKLLVAAGQNEAGYIMRCLQVMYGCACSTRIILLPPHMHAILEGGKHAL